MENNQSKKEQFLKLNFFKKVWYSIIEFEKYPELAALGVKKAIIYFTQLILIFCIIYTGCYVYYVSNIANFEEENLTLSQKIMKTTIGENVDETQKSNIMERASLYSDKTIIATLFANVVFQFYLSTLLDVFTLSIFGLFTCMVAKIKMNYKAVFNMSIYALTFSIILRTIYFAITILTGFKIKYFEVMYISIAYITLTAVIFMIKSDVMKQHLELMKIIEENKEKIEQKITIQKKEKKEEKEENDKKDKKENEDENEEGTEEQGSNA